MGDHGGAEERAAPSSRHEVVPGTLKARLAEEQRSALKSGDRLRLSALRLLSASVTNREVELGRPLGDPEFVEVARREVKRRREAVEAFGSAGRSDRAAIEQAEQAILEAYLPPGLSDSEVDALVEETVVELGATGPGDLGRVIGRVMARAQGRADGRMVQAKVRARLSG